jgi:hypothetical protein
MVVVFQQTCESGVRSSMARCPIKSHLRFFRRLETRLPAPELEGVSRAAYSRPLIWPNPIGRDPGLGWFLESDVSDVPLFHVVFPAELAELAEQSCEELDGRAGGMN